MKYIFIESSRSHKDKNPKEERNKEMEKYYLLERQCKYPTYFISFTDLLKIGINPNNVYSTPLGIYTYPLRYMYKKILKDDVPFASERPYIQVVKRVSKKFFNSKTYKESTCKSDIEKLKKFYKKQDIAEANVKNLINNIYNYLSFSNIDDFGDIEDADFTDFDVVMSIAETLVGSWHAQYKGTYKSSRLIWSLTQIISYLISTNNQSSTVKWNYLFRKILEYDLIIDYNIGLVHINEPCQAVFFSKEALSLEATIHNIIHKTHDTPRYLVKFKKNITEKDYKKLIKKCPSIEELQGKDIELLKETSSGKTAIKASLLNNCTIRISCFYTKIRNCTLDYPSYKETKSYNYFIKNYPTYDECNIDKCNIKFSSLHHTVVENSEISNSMIIKNTTLTNCIVSTTVVNKNFSIEEDEYTIMNNCTINSGTYWFTVFNNCKFPNRSNCEFAYCKFNEDS